MQVVWKQMQPVPSQGNKDGEVYFNRLWLQIGGTVRSPQAISFSSLCFLSDIHWLTGHESSAGCLVNLTDGIPLQCGALGHPLITQLHDRHGSPCHTLFSPITLSCWQFTDTSQYPPKERLSSELSISSQTIHPFLKSLQICEWCVFIISKQAKREDFHQSCAFLLDAETRFDLVFLLFFAYILLSRELKEAAEAINHFKCPVQPQR